MSEVEEPVKPTPSLAQESVTFKPIPSTISHQMAGNFVVLVKCREQVALQKHFVYFNPSIVASVAKKQC